LRVQSPGLVRRRDKGTGRRLMVIKRILVVLTMGWNKKKNQRRFRTIKKKKKMK
jgi:hypothetical protein